MAVPTLNDYEYWFNEVLLNADSVSLPFIDVTKVSGLDLPPVDVVVDSIQGRHGSAVSASFFSHRTIVVDAILYASNTAIDTTIVTLNKAFSPLTAPSGFYYKHPGDVQKYISCLPTAFKYDIDTLRRVGACNMQIQFAAADPRRYVNNTDYVLSKGVAYTPASGDVYTYPVVKVYGQWERFKLSSGGKTISLDYGGPATAHPTTSTTLIYIQFDKQIITLDSLTGTNISSWYIANTTSDRWWKLEPGNSVTYTDATAYTPTVTLISRKGWM